MRYIDILAQTDAAMAHAIGLFFAFVGGFCLALIVLYIRDFLLNGPQEGEF